MGGIQTVKVVNYEFLGGNQTAQVEAEIDFEAEVILQSKLEAKHGLGASTGEIEVDVEAGIGVKAPSCEVVAEIGVKAPSCEVEAGIDVHAPSCEVEAGIDVRAPSCEVETGIGVKAPSCEAEAEIGVKAPSCEVGAEVGVKAPPCEVEAEIGVKAPSCKVEAEIGVEDDFAQFRSPVRSVHYFIRWVHPHRKFAWIDLKRCDLQGYLPGARPYQNPPLEYLISNPT